MYEDIPSFNTWSKIEVINKGWSYDEKYSIEDNKGERLLLRIADISEYEKKKEEYNHLLKVSKLNIIASKPIDFGVCSNGNKVYSLYNWVEGIDAEEALPKLSSEKQYQLGREAGKALRLIHSINLIEEHQREDWAVRFGNKIEKKIKAYNDCPIKIEHGDIFIDVIKENIHLLKGREQVFQHGDFHVGNLLITPDEKIGVIDFNRYDFGDPWEEFNRIVFSWKVSNTFAKGSIEGYFDSNVPEEFFRLLALYISVNAIASVPWAMTYGQEEVNTMINNAKEIYESYDGFTTYTPKWYCLQR